MIVRTSKRDNLAFFDKTVLWDESLSWKAKGIASYLLAHANAWEISITDLVRRGPDGESAVRSGINELIKAGYIDRQAERNNDGTIARWVYTLHEVKPDSAGALDTPDDNDNPDAPIAPDHGETSAGDQPLCGFPHVDNPDVDNRYPNKEISSSSRKKEIYPADAGPTDGAEKSTRAKVFDRLEQEWLTVNPAQVEKHAPIAEKYGFEAWLRGFEASPRGARSNAAYVEKATISNLPEEEQKADTGEFYKCVNVKEASGWLKVVDNVLRYRAVDGTEYVSRHLPWVNRVADGLLDDNLLAGLYERGRGQTA